MDEDPSEFFGHRAKVLLEIEMDSPTLATVQALLVLAAHEATRVRDTRGEFTSSSSVLLPICSSWTFLQVGYM
jgi:hypothetical protein